MMSLISQIRSWFKLKKINDIVPPGTKLAFTKKDLISTNYTHGVEIGNNDSTEIQYVVNFMMKHFDLEKSDAITATHICHNFVSVVLPLDSEVEAGNVVDRINNELRKDGQSLVCKVTASQQVIQANLNKPHR